MGVAARRAWLAAFGLAVAGGIAYAFLPRPLEVESAVASRGPLVVTVDEDGRTRIRERYVVASPLAGRLLRIDLHAGDPVEAGVTVVALIEPTDPTLLDERTRTQAEARVKAAEAAQSRAQTATASAQATYDHAKARLDRMRHAAREGAVAAQELDDAVTAERTTAEDLRAARFGLQIAAFELDQARAALLEVRPPTDGGARTGRFEIRAPVSGQVLRVLQESATVVAPGSTLLEVGDATDLEVEVDVLTRDAVRVRPGARVLLEQWGGEKPLEGRVRRVEPSAFTKVSALGVEEQRVWVIVDLVDPPEARRALGDAFRVEARIVVWEASDVLRVPAGALFRRGERWAVFVVEGGRARRREVTVGESSGLETQVVSGIAAGEVVIVHPGDRVRDGAAVRVR